MRSIYPVKMNLSFTNSCVFIHMYAYYLQHSAFLYFIMRLIETLA
jgi:hypothetical protein